MLRRPNTNALQPVWLAALHHLQLQLIMVAADVEIAGSAQTSLAVAGRHLILFSNVIRVTGHS